MKKRLNEKGKPNCGGGVENAEKCLYGQANGTLTVGVQVQPVALRSGTHMTHKSVDVHTGQVQPVRHVYEKVEIFVLLYIMVTLAVQCDLYHPCQRHHQSLDLILLHAERYTVCANAVADSVYRK